MNEQQMQMGKLYLAGWLLNEELLDKKPSKIEFAFDFDGFGLHYYVYKFKKSPRGKWLVGVCGFYGDSTDNIGHCLSGLEEYEEDSVRELTMRMAEFLDNQDIRAYMQDIFTRNLKYISRTEADVDKIAGQFVKTNERFYLSVGTVDVPSGKVIVADPLCYLYGKRIAPVLKKTIPGGSYPAEVSICRNPVDSIRMCTARLKIKDTLAVRYELAEPEEETAAFKASDGVMCGFPVDAGMMCFIDVSVADHYNAFLDKWHKENPGKNHYDDYFAKFFADSSKALPQYQRDGGDFIEWANPDTGERMVQIASGFGDGFYQCYWGYDESDEICELIVPMVDPDLFNE